MVVHCGGSGGEVTAGGPQRRVSQAPRHTVMVYLEGVVLLKWVSRC